MAIKQTQTKFYAFSDADLDLSSVSKAKLPLAFKKILNTGYNEKTVTSVSVSGNHVTLTYGGSHGYVADRVLKIGSGALTSINGGEFVIDSVTANTVTLTVDGAPLSIAGGFTTKVAPLGWDLVYESGLVYLYKMRYLDERDLYIRLVFAPTGTHKSMANVCVGKTANEMTGEITDTYGIPDGRVNSAAVSGFMWMFSYITTATGDSYTYAQGAATYGNFYIVGSKYHIACMCSTNNANFPGRFLAILPTKTLDYDVLDYPLVIGNYSTSALTSSLATDQPQFSNIAIDQLYSHFMIGTIPIALTPFDAATATTISNVGITSFLPSAITTFNTLSCSPIHLYERSTAQFIGVVSAGAYRGTIKVADAGSLSGNMLPRTTYDIDDPAVLVAYQYVWATSSNLNVQSFFAPVEKVKYVS